MKMSFSFKLTFHSSMFVYFRNFFLFVALNVTERERERKTEMIMDKMVLAKTHIKNRLSENDSK